MYAACKYACWYSTKVAALVHDRLEEDAGSTPIASSHSRLCPQPMAWLLISSLVACHITGAKIYLKREDLNHTWLHKINHCLGEALLAKSMGKEKLIAETGAGQHSMELASAAVLMQLECEIHMEEVDIKKEWPNV